MAAYYNEIDPYAAEWLRNLIKAGHIAPGVVDERSIEDIKPAELVGYTQCHFFAGVGAWSLALRRAGWPDNRPVWTGSCPCQPFSSAGAGGGFADPRHLWPSFAWLIKQCAPPVVIGEQVASKAVEPWVDLVQADLEALGYAFGAVPFPAAGIGAPNIRDRLYWVAHANSSTSRQGRPNFRGRATGSDAQPRARSSSSSMPGGLDHADGARLQGRPGSAEAKGQSPASPGWAGRLADDDSSGRASDAIGKLYDAEYHAEPCGSAERMANTELQQRPDGEPRVGAVDDPSGWLESAAAPSGLCGDMRPGPVNGFWSDADWLFCRDGKWRPVEPGTFPLVARAPAELGRVQPGLARLYGRNRTGRLKGYGNAINAGAAQTFIAAYMQL